MQSWREIIKSSIYDFYWSSMFIKKLHSCQNNQEKSYTEGKAKHEPWGGAIVTQCLFDADENKSDYYRVRDCIKSCVKN